jgi:hypothetical protein
VLADIDEGALQAAMEEFTVAGHQLVGVTSWCAVRAVPAVGKQRPLHAWRAHGVAHAPNGQTIFVTAPLRPGEMSHVLCIYLFWMV